jgi:hypothetical protein
MVSVLACAKQESGLCGEATLARGRQKGRGGSEVTRAKRAAGTILLALVALVLLAQPPQGVHASGPTPAESQATLKALLYVHTQQSATDGSVGSSVAQTAQFVVAAAIDGYDPNTLSNGGPTAMQYLANGAGQPGLNAGQVGWLIQAALAAGDDPTKFGGVNLLTSLKTHYAAGLYDSGDAFTQSLAILALESDHQSVPAAALADLQASQDSDGGWNFLASKDNPAGFGSDTNSTAMVLMALDGAVDHTHDLSALAWLATQQQSDGGFAFQTPCYPTPPCSDPDSDALVAQALIATGQDLGSALWTKGGNTVISNLLVLQTAGGGFTGYSGVDAFTTVQVPPALEGVAFPVDFIGHVYYSAGNQLRSGLPTPTPTPVITGGLTSPISTVAPTATAQVAAVHTAVVAENFFAANAAPSVAPATTAPSPSPTSAVLGTSTTSPPPTATVALAKSSSNWWIYLLAALLGVVIAAGATIVLTRSKPA